MTGFVYASEQPDANNQRKALLAYGLTKERIFSAVETDQIEGASTCDKDLSA